jgi:hypothetical protein
MRFFTLFLFIPLSLFAGVFDEHIAKEEESLQHIRTPEDRKLMGFYSALFDMAEKRNNPAGEIPKTLHFIWLGPRPFPEKSTALVKEWIDLHPGWKIKFWTDLGAYVPDDRMEVHSFDQFPLQELKECYHKSDNFGERSQLLRYAVLLEEGGVYIDHDVGCLKPLGALQQSYDFFCGMDLIGRTVLSSSLNPSPHLLASTPQHPILKAGKKWLMSEWDSLENQYPGSDPSSVHNRVQHRSFKALGVGIKEAHNRSGRRDAVFPPDFFSLSERKSAVYAVHRHQGSWYRPEASRENKEKRLFKSVKKEFSRTYALGLSLAAVNVGMAGFMLYPLLRKKKGKK